MCINKYILLLSFFLAGCANYSACPKVKNIEPLDLPIWHVKDNAANSEIVKRTVESQKICVHYANNCYEVLNSYEN